MPRGLELSIEIKGQIIGMINCNKSARQIGLELNIPYSTISYIVRRFNKTGSNENLPRSGCPSILTKCDKNHLERMSKVNWFTPLHHIVGQLPLNVSVDTAWRALKERGINQYEAAKKPYLKPENVQKRKTWCNSVGNWSEEEWHKVIWTDESSLELG